MRVVVLYLAVRQLEQELAAVKQEASTSMDRLRAKSRSRVKSVEEKWQQKVRINNRHMDSEPILIPG